MPLTVTFDTGALDDVVSPKSAKEPTNRADALTVHAALQSGQIQGFFSETLMTLEGIQNNDRLPVFESSRLVSSSSSGGTSKIKITLAFEQNRRPLHPRFSKRIQDARNLGMCALMVPRLLGNGVCAKDDAGTLFEPITKPEEFVAKATNIRNEIGARGLGHAVLMNLGLRFSARDGVSEWWYHGLRRAKDENERRQVQKAVAEWADGDSIAAHYGYAIKLFCSKDFGGRYKTTGKYKAPSILDPDNRNWLMERFGIQFVEIAHLAKMVTA